MSEFNSWKERKARKEFICDLCREKIIAGEKYVREVGVYENEFYSRALHAKCSDAISNYCKEYGVSEFDLDSVLEYMLEQEERMKNVKAEYEAWNTRKEGKK